MESGSDRWKSCKLQRVSGKSTGTSGEDRAQRGCCHRQGKINGRDTVIAVCDGRFLMASMGWAVGEKITRAVERATEEKLPIIILPVLVVPECRKESHL